MLATIFKAFEATEIQLTPSAIKRLRISAILGVFTVPIYAAVEVLNLPDGVNNVLIPLCLLCGLALLYAFSTRIANRLWVPEKYLDESEIDRKRRSGSITYQIMIIALMVIIVALTLSQRALGDFPWDTKAVFYFTGVLLFIAMSLQTVIAAYMMSPISEGKVEKVAADGQYKWIVAVFLVVFGVLGVGISALA